MIFLLRYNKILQAKKLCVFVMLALLSIVANAQLYPVQVTPQLVPPYSVYLSDYATPGNEKLRVIILQRDLTQPAYQLRLVMVVSLHGKAIMRTSRAFNPLPLNISPGIPTVVSGADLAPYLDSRNIEFVGYSREQYERTRALPEGAYQISFIAYDYRRPDVQVSNEGISFYYLAKNEPPLINYPACGTKIPLLNPQQVVFSWLPRNTSSPNSAAETEYEFSLYEVRPAGRNPNDVVMTTPPVFRTRLDFTQLVYGPAEPLLLEGMQYVWRVQAIDKNDKDAFRNNGFSEVCTFTYGGTDVNYDIGRVKNLQAEGETERRAKIFWETGAYDEYDVFYKKTGTGYEWFNSKVKTNELKLFDLEPDTEYETRVQVKKGTVWGAYSDIVVFRTLPQRVAQCGDEQPTFNTTPGSPLAYATTGMIINARGMEMQLVEVQHLGENGWYKGIGRVAIDYFGGASFMAKFDRVYIDDNRNVVLGRIDLVSKGVAAMIEQQLADQRERQEEKQQQENRDEWVGTDFYEKIFLFDNLVIGDVTPGTDSYITITDSQGTTTANAEVMQVLNTYPEKAIVIEDKNGDQWVVQKDKVTGATKVSKVSGGGLSPAGNVVVSKDDLEIVKKALRELRKEYTNKVSTYSSGDRIEFTIATAIIYFSDETSSKAGYKLIAQGLSIGDQKVTEYLAQSRSENKPEQDQVLAVKQAIVHLVGNTMKGVLFKLDEWKEQLTQAVGTGYRSSLGAGPLAYAPYLLPSCMPADKEDRAIVRDYLEIADKNTTVAEKFIPNLIESVSQSLFIDEDTDSELCSFVVQQAGEYYLRFKLSEFGELGECAERGYEKGKQELFKSGISGAFIIAQLEVLICLTEEEKCASSGSGAQFSYGLANGLLQQLNIPEMRDAVIELVKSTTITKWGCLFNPVEVKRKLTEAKDPKEIVKILTGCLLGIEVDVAEANLLFESSWQYVKSHYTEPYFQGQATAFIVTIVLPPVVKALQASKLGQLLKNARAGIVKYVKNSRNLEGLENGLDEVVEGVAEGAGKFVSFKNISKLPDNIRIKIEAKGWADDVLTKLDADLADDAFKLKLTNEVDVVDGWGILRNTSYKTNPRYLDYVNSLKNEAKFGTSVRKDYRKTFFEAFPELTESDYVIHHAIEQQVLKNFPGIITEAEMHSLQNLRGVPKTINSDVHLRRIRSEWDDFYLDNPNPTKQQLLQKAKEIDDLLGSQFYPPVR